MVIEQSPDAVSEWDGFLKSLDFGALVPAAYERYRPAIVDGLDFFLENLAADRAMEILGEQACMPASTAAADGLVAIARHCPALQKLGQVLARDRRLPADFRRLLQHLETMPSSMSVAESRRLAESELGPLTQLEISIDEPPLAEASVAIVVPFTWHRNSGEVAQGVLKLLKPGIERKLEEELELLRRIGALLDERCEAYGLPRIDYEDAFLQVKTLLSREVCLDREQEHMRAARREFSGSATVIVPEVYEFSTPRVTAMQRIFGGKATDAGFLTAQGRRKLADTIVKTLLARPIWSKSPQALFHADPHAGNLFATADGKLALLDWSLVGHLGKDDRVQLTQVLVGALTMDASRVREAIHALAQGGADTAALDQIIHQHIASISEGAFPGLSWVMQLMDEAAMRARCRFAGDLLMFRKVLQTLEGVVADVSPDCHTDRVLIGAFVRELLLEWGQRPFSLPSSRHFATHFSNVDLAQLLMTTPFIGSLRWMDWQSAWLRDAGLGWAR